MVTRGERKRENLSHIVFGVAKDPLGRHVLGGRTQVDGHMCPGEGCGYPPRTFCPVCLGVGIVSEARLAAWQAGQLDQHPELREATR